MHGRVMNEPGSALVEQCRRFSRVEPPPALQALSHHLQRRYGEHLTAILYYGSCLRGGDPFDGLVDLYVVVSAYRPASSNTAQALANALLPPNVFYLEMELDGRTLRCKYAVVSEKQLQRHVAPGCFHPYFWARFAQPMALLYARDEPAAGFIHRQQAQAIRTFCRKVLPCLPAAFTVADVWRQGLRLTYGAELRAERTERADELFRHHEAYYRTVTPLALAHHPRLSPAGGVCYQADFSPRQRQWARMAWRLRTIQGKSLSVMRLLKAFFTFEGGLDYLVWKLERHTGVAIEITPRLRRWPLIFIWGLMWRLYRQGVIR